MTIGIYQVDDVEGVRLFLDEHVHEDELTPAEVIDRAIEDAFSDEDE